MVQQPVRRQARGERRIEQILAAAARVLARDGYEGATTNAIAREAEISPGSLYQFFRSKDEIVGALAAHYTTALRAVQDEAFAGVDPVALPLDALVERVLSPLVAFNAEHRGFKALFARTDMPAALREATAPLHVATEGRVTALLTARAPGASSGDVRRTAVVAIQLVRGMVPLVADAPDDERAALEVELRRAVVSYLAAALPPG